MESRVSLVFRHLLQGRKHHANSHINNAVIAVDEASLFATTFCSAFNVISKNHSCAALQKCCRKHRVCHAAQMVNSAITMIREEASTTTNKWLTLEAWTTIFYQHYDLDDEPSSTMIALTRAANFVGSIDDSNVRGEGTQPKSIFASIISSSKTRMERKQERIISDSCCLSHNPCSRIGCVMLHGFKNPRSKRKTRAREIAQNKQTAKCSHNSGVGGGNKSSIIFMRSHDVVRHCVSN
jgi:hypothetical protein